MQPKLVEVNQTSVSIVFSIADQDGRDRERGGKSVGTIFILIDFILLVRTPYGTRACIHT